MAEKPTKSAKKSGTPAGVKDAMKKATTEMLILSMLSQRPMYTYEMMREIERRSQNILVYNTLYIAIYRLKDFGYIEESGKVLSDDNHMRVFFSVTDSGRNYYARIVEEYKLVIDAIDKFIFASEN